MNDKKKILYYNWCPTTNKLGGGIVVYQNNLLNELSKYSDTLDVYFLSSGFYYDKTKYTYLKQESNAQCKLFSIVNSPIYAPIKSPANNVTKMIKDDTLFSIFKQFIIDNGPFEVIHFQSFEGLPISVLELKQNFPETKFICSLHNYTLFCPNVQLWNINGKNCMLCDVDDCARCMRSCSVPSTTLLKKFRYFINSNNFILFYLSRCFVFLFRQTFKMLPLKANKSSADFYKNYRQSCVSSINKYCDDVLAVSERVREIAISFGVNENLVKTSYIGTKFSEMAQYKSIKEPTDDFSIVYMGYSKKEKGFFFFLECLEQLNKEKSKNINVTFASKINNPLVLYRLRKLKKKFKSVTLYNGYTHDDIKKIVSNNDLGVVPVIWEDNLPQVAIEMAASGLPVLASSFGGASEINSNPQFRFNGDDTIDFINKLEQIYSNRVLLANYWKSSMKFVSMKNHIDELFSYYDIKI